MTVKDVAPENWEVFPAALPGERHCHKFKGTHEGEECKLTSKNPWKYRDDPVGGSAPLNRKSALK